MNDRKRILLVYTSYGPFVQQDDATLSEHYRVERFHFLAARRPAALAFQFVRQLFVLLTRGWRYDAFFIWFADHHAFLPVLFARLTGKKSLIVAGGYDATAIEELGYGLFVKRSVRSFMGRNAFEWCSRILPVDRSLIRNTNTYAAAQPFETGIAHYCNVPESKFNAIATGYCPDHWKANASLARENSVLTVAGVARMSTWKLKGGDLLVEIARLLPQYRFYFYGVYDYFRSQLIEQLSIPDNFHIMGRIDSEQLPDVYSQHRVYAQLSMSEGLPNALCEAMLCGCIPVGSNVNGIPKVIGETGHVLTNRDAAEAATHIARLLNSPATNEPRERIIQNYSLGQRESKLRELIDR